MAIGGSWVLDVRMKLKGVGRKRHQRKEIRIKYRRKISKIIMVGFFMCVS